VFDHERVKFWFTAGLVLGFCAGAWFTLITWLVSL
jgi:hypothetical protein